MKRFVTRHDRYSKFLFLARKGQSGCSFPAQMIHLARTVRTVSEGPNSTSIKNLWEMGIHNKNQIAFCNQNEAYALGKANNNAKLKSSQRSKNNSIRKVNL